MALVTLVGKLIGFGLRQAIGEYIGNAADVLGVIRVHFSDASQSLPQALTRANDRTWKALGVALAGNGLLDRVKVLLADGTDKALRGQVDLFLKTAAVDYAAAPADFRKNCLAELKQARQVGHLSAERMSAGEVARHAADFRRYTDPTALAAAAHQAIAGLANDLAGSYPRLAQLLRLPTPGGPPLPAAAFAYFFRREIETNDELSNALTYDGLRMLSAAQAKGFDEVGLAINRLGDRFDDALQEVLDSVAATHRLVQGIDAKVDRLAAQLNELSARPAIAIIGTHAADDAGRQLSAAAAARETQLANQSQAALLKGDAETARRAAKSACDADPTAPRAHLLLALAMLAGQSISALAGKEAKEVDSILQVALASRETRSAALVALAALRHCWHRYKGRDEPSPDFDEIKRQARSIPAPSAEQHEMLKQMKEVDNFWYAWKR